MGKTLPKRSSKCEGITTLLYFHFIPTFRLSVLSGPRISSNEFLSRSSFSVDNHCIHEFILGPKMILRVLKYDFGIDIKARVEPVLFRLPQHAFRPHSCGNPLLVKPASLSIH